MARHSVRLAYQNDDGSGGSPLIRHNNPAPIGAEPPKPKIKSFDQGLGALGHKEDYKRPLNLTGKGATRVRSFHCKLGGDSLEYLDRQINDWLDDHPDIEVKNVTSTVGEWSGKLKEPNLIVQVWY